MVVCSDVINYVGLNDVVIEVVFWLNLLCKLVNGLGYKYINVGCDDKGHGVSYDQQCRLILLILINSRGLILRLPEEISRITSLKNFIRYLIT